MIYGEHCCALNEPVMCQDCVDKLRERCYKLEELAKMLYGEWINGWTYADDKEAVHMFNELIIKYYNDSEDKI